MRGLLIDGSWVEDRCKVKGEVIFFLEKIKGT